MNWIKKSNGAPASRSQLVKASLIDYALGLSLGFFALLHSAQLIMQGGYPVGSQSNGQQMLVMTLTLLAYFGVYRWQLGQSLGRALMGIRPAEDPGSNPAHPAALVFLVLFLFATMGYMPLRFFPRDSELALTTHAKRGLNELRSPISLLWADKNGQLGAKIEISDLVPTYMPRVPALNLNLPGKQPSREIEVYPFTDKKGNIDPARLRDSGHWAVDPRTGMTIIDSKLEWLAKPLWKTRGD